MPEGSEYTLQELARIADVTPRTIRYYIAQGLLPAPAQSGPNARYTQSHLLRLRLIRKLQSANQPLALIRALLRATPEDQLEDMVADTSKAKQVSDGASAMEYIRGLLGPPGETTGSPVFARQSIGETPATPVPAPPAIPAGMPAMRELPLRSRPSGPSTKPTEVGGPPGSEAIDRSQWERISVHPDVEIHVRRPLTRHANKRLDRLIEIARQLLKEE